MLKLTPKNIPKYLKRLKYFKNVDWSSVQVEEVTRHTNVNYVFRVQMGMQVVYLKQAFGFVKVSPTFKAPLSRQLFEKKSIDYLQDFWPGRIPKVIHLDHQDHVLILTDIGQNTVLLANDIERGKLHLNVAPDLGKLMASLHYPTYSQNTYPARNKADNQKHLDFILDFRLRGSREILPQETTELFKNSLTSKTSIIYGDWASKNLLIAGDKIKVVDFENLTRFDPAFDIGYALAHWALEINSRNRKDISSFFHKFEIAYAKPWPLSLKNDITRIFTRASKYTGAMMLHRLAGVKNTNRLEQYQSRETELVVIAKHLLQGNYISPSLGISTAI